MVRKKTEEETGDNMPVVEERELSKTLETNEEATGDARVISYGMLKEMKKNLIDEANTLFGGSTDATLMVRKIEEVFECYA